MGQSSTYSFKDVSGSLVDPNLGTFPLQGQIGFGQITIDMTTERTIHDVAADGTVMPTYVAGDNGSVSIEVQQTSELNAFLQSAFNASKTLADNQDVTTWAAATLTLRSLVDGTLHLCRGLSFSKVPPKTYASQGARRTWVLMATDIQTVNT